MKTVMSDAPADPVVELDERWRERRIRWGRKLGRLRLDVEPLETQLARHRRVAWGLTTVSTIIGSMFIALFSAFGRPDVGLIVVAISLLPIVVFHWLGYLRIARRARAFEREYDVYRSERQRLMESTPTNTTPRSD
jgi:hypothetical protein